MEDLKDSLWRIIGSVLTVLAVGALMAAIAVIGSGCSRRVYVPAQTVSVRTDTVVRVVDRLLTDTVSIRSEVYVLQQDSVAPIVDSLNRVIGWERWHWRERSSIDERERARLVAQIDSLRQVTADSVYVDRPVPYEVVREVPRPYPWWAKALMAFGVVSIAVGVWLTARYFRRIT